MRFVSLPVPLAPMVVALAALAALVSAPRTSKAQTSAPPEAPASPEVPAKGPSTRWGEVGVENVTRFGRLILPSPELGSSGLIQGSGAELRFTLPIGWGAYYRYTDSATRNGDNSEWGQWEFVAGISRRVLRVGRADLWAFRAAARWDLGIGWSQIGTHGSCTRSFVAFGTSCSDVSVNAKEIHGDAMVLEGRLAGDIGFGPIGLGLDIGFAANTRITTGDRYLSPPTYFFIPSGQLRLGIVLPFT